MLRSEIHYRSEDVGDENEVELIYIPSGNQSEGESDDDFAEDDIPLADFVQSDVELMSEFDDSDSDDDQPLLSLKQSTACDESAKPKKSKCANEKASKKFQVGEEGPPVVAKVNQSTKEKEIHSSFCCTTN